MHIFRTILAELPESLFDLGDILTKVTKKSCRLYPCSDQHFFLEPLAQINEISGECHDIGDTHFYSARCSFHKVVNVCPHFYNLPTSRGAFAHLFRTPLCDELVSSKLHVQVTSRCSEMSASINFVDAAITPKILIYFYEGCLLEICLFRSLMFLGTPIVFCFQNDGKQLRMRF